MAESGREPMQKIGNGDFPAVEHRNKDKQEKAQIYADWLIEEKNIRPVLIDSATLYYQYDPDNKRWSEIDFELIKKKAHRDIGTDLTRHFFTQFKLSFQNHYKYKEFEDLGLEPEELLLKNGKILNLEDMSKREAKKEDMALNAVNTVYNPEAEAENLEDFIHRTLDTEEDVKTVQEYLGYCLKWPSAKYEKALLILGYTDTGKSTLLEIFEKLFEKSNTTKIGFPEIGMKRAFHVDKLTDSVINFDRDMDDKEIPRKSRIKKAISNEELFADPKGEQGYNFKPRTKFMIASNNAPKDNNATDAFYNRFLTVKATTRVDEEDKDRELVDKLTTEEHLQWLLNWAIEGLHRLESQNRFTGEMTEYETKKTWDKFGSSTQRFISEQIKKGTDESGNLPTQDVYDAYKVWCETKLESPVTSKKFIAQAASHPDLVKRKAQSKNGSRRSCFIDIEVRDYEV